MTDRILLENYSRLWNKKYLCHFRLFFSNYHIQIRRSLKDHRMIWGKDFLDMDGHLQTIWVGFFFELWGPIKWIGGLLEINSMLYTLYDGDTHSIKNWLMTPNHLFFGATPYEMILNGKINIVRRTLDEWI